MLCVFLSCVWPGPFWPRTLGSHTSSIPGLKNFVTSFQFFLCCILIPLAKGIIISGRSGLKEPKNGLRSTQNLGSTHITSRPGGMFYFVQAPLTKHHRLGGLNDKNLFLKLLEDGKSKIKVELVSF
jgi:hypothetical protein